MENSMVGRPFEPGKSGNPGGRPKADKRLRELAQAQTESAVATLVGIMESKTASDSARVSAASTILDRGWGKAPQTIQGDEDEPVRMIQEIVLRGVAANAGDDPNTG